MLKLSIHRAIIAAVAGAALSMLLPTGVVAATTTTTYQVTFVARECPEYTDVTANLARNDIQESLRDLGADTAYTSGQAIDFDIETDNQPKCTPLVGWKFKLGNGIGGKDTGTFGSLSKVSNPDSTSIVTQSSTPLLNRYGSSTGRAVAGATTITLTAAQADRATKRQLWTQGGVPGDPVLNSIFPDEYGFAALRCAIDNLNGDNVEYIAYPSGTKHMLCYAYYVTPPPTSGNITIEKALTDVGPDDTYSETFSFDSNLTYDPSNRFDLAASEKAGSARTFIRAQTRPGDAPWYVDERPLDGWERASLTCTSKLNTSSILITGGRATIRLAASDSVTCRYENRPDAGGPFIVAKRTIITPGAFPFTVTSPTGKIARETLRPVRPLTADSWDTGFTAAGTYRVSEQLPTSNLGTWRPIGVNCDGTRYPARTTVTHRVATASGGGRCLFTNYFAARGSITVRGVTIGGTASIDWDIEGPETFTRTYSKFATTQTPGEAVTASGNSTNSLRGGLYAIVQHSIIAPGRAWKLIDITCDGGIVERDLQGGTYVRLTENTPHVTCTFTNIDTTVVDPTDPGTGGGTGGGETPGGGGTTPTDPGHIGPTPDAVDGDPRAPVGGVATGTPASQLSAPWRPWTSDSALLTKAPDEVSARRTARLDPRTRYVVGTTLRVPRLGIRARLQPLALTRGRQLQVPANPRRVGWWSGGALPGAAGPTVLAGHVDGPGGPAVFSRLWRTQRGDRITLTTATGLTLRYRVTAVKSYRKSQLPTRQVFGATRGNTLRLVTCGGSFNTATGRYSDNVVVYAVPV